MDSWGGGEAILVEWGHHIKSFASQMAEFRLDVVGTGSH